MKNRFRVKGGLGDLINKAKSALNAWSGRFHFKIIVNNDVYYFRWVEEGTSKMAPRGMVAKSLPLIQEFAANQIKLLGPFPTEEDIDRAIERTRQFALDTIRSKTPIGVDKKLPNGEMHKAGTLVRGFTVEVLKE